MDQLRSLRVFVSVAAQGSLAGAARALDLAPAVVTRAVAELEQHVGARLLQRTTRRMALTSAGERYLSRAQHVLQVLDEADAEAGAAATLAQGTLRLLCPPAFAAHQIVPRLPALRLRHPRLQLEVLAPGAVEAADPHFDVTIVSAGRQALQGDFVLRRLARSDFLLCASPSYLSARGMPAEPEDLLVHEVALPAVSAVRREVTLYPVAAPTARSAARTLSLPTPRAALVTGQIELLFAAAQAGLGIVGLPSFVAAGALTSGELVRVLPGWRGESLSLHAALPSRRQLPARTRLFVDFLVEVFGGQDHDPWLA
jgi:DNA-binding transcriptional LysR family regulator